MLRQVSIDQWKKETSVEELGDEYTVGDGCETLTIGILADPSDSSDDNFLENSVESNDNSGDRERKNTSHSLVIEESLADRNFYSIFFINWVFIHFISVHFVVFTDFAEALQSFSVMSFLSGILNCCLREVFIYCFYF